MYQIRDMGSPVFFADDVCKESCILSSMAKVNVDLGSVMVQWTEANICIGSGEIGELFGRGAYGAVVSY